MALRPMPSRPRWLHLCVAVLVGLGLMGLADVLAPNGGWRIFVQVLAVLLIFGGIAAWVRLNRVRLVQEHLLRETDGGAGDGPAASLPPSAIPAPQGDQAAGDTGPMARVGAALVLLALLTGLTGLVYPLAVTALAQALLPRQANGSLILEDGKAVGSELIGQFFDDPKYFWGRPSATIPFPYNAGASTASNHGPTNPDLQRGVKERVEVLRAADPGNTAPVPIDLVTASASGLDPHISPAAALYQVRRVARARGLDETTVRQLVEGHVEDRMFGVLGESRVNVLLLNLALDRQQKT